MGVLKYKGFIASIDYSEDDEVFYGKISGINDLILFEGSSVEELKNSFEEAVEDYLELCREVNKDPYKSFKGSFNVRIPKDLHRQLYIRAQKAGLSLNQFIKRILEKEVGQAAGND